MGRKGNRRVVADTLLLQLGIRSRKLLSNKRKRSRFFLQERRNKAINTMMSRLLRPAATAARRFGVRGVASLEVIDRVQELAPHHQWLERWHRDRLRVHCFVLRRTEVERSVAQCAVA
jgi:hypothetical protein